MGAKIRSRGSGGQKSLKSIEKKFTERSPLFVFTNLMEAHAPYMVPLTFKRKFSSRRTPKEGVTNAQGNPTDEELEERINLYDDCIRYLDNKLGDFIDKVEKKHSETVFIITADHGELFLDNRLEFEDRKQGHTASSSDGILKVPLIIYGDFEPEKFDPEKPISLRDLGGIVESLADDQGFESSGLAISENLWSKGVCSKTITDGENRVVVTENDIHYIGEKKKCEMLEKSLRESTETFEKIDSLMEERNLADDIDI